ncbi:PQQ-dependent sugar dehydrogenase [Aquibacillus koreensis]|uniref:PQQ-dependent sugar dehydrogenase n=1 Tax=Aquibacillus koreensis TaxID=279446 RepID=A0A9X4ALJ2_9BACI|nr:PQQ-dependent sugar dehydrogenase [Aquibacillus koreensis]MCT2535335.1 PQQ-dependent sugar dehydrogenase [Aquibacillus koreensis]MDC3422500.1 PQQ-dependent sugar dehydrogenase [Aquibacillus koreensis]
MEEVSVNLQPVVHNLNLPTVIKSTILPGDTVESLFIATQIGEIFYIRNGEIKTFLDIRSHIIELDGYDERGLLGLAFHPGFYYNGLFYIHYSVAGTDGPGALSDSFEPDPCDPSTLNLEWTNRETQYSHINTIEEWGLQPDGRPQKRRTLLRIRRPFTNHNGVNNLNFSPETGKLVFTDGDGGSGYDPFNLSQNNLEIAGKIIEIDVTIQTDTAPPVVTRFNELPEPIQATLSVMAKGVRNIPGISYQRFYNQYIKYVGNVGQDLVESIFSFVHYNPIPVTQLVQVASTESSLNEAGMINFGWRAWEGTFPTSILRDCAGDGSLDEKVMAYYKEAVKISTNRLSPLTEYFHQDPRTDKFEATALTGVQAYMGTRIPALTGTVVFSELSKKGNPDAPTRGTLAYTRYRPDGKLNDFSEIKTNDPFKSDAAYYVSLGTNMDQSKIYVGVYGSMKVTDYNQGTVFEVVASG